MIRTHSEAKRFLVDKVVAQARVERMPLSDAERQMLSWSESRSGLGDVRNGDADRWVVDVDEVETVLDTELAGLSARPVSDSWRKALSNTALQLASAFI